MSVYRNYIYYDKFHLNLLLWPNSYFKLHVSSPEDDSLWVETCSHTKFIVIYIVAINLHLFFRVFGIIIRNKMKYAKLKDISWSQPTSFTNCDSLKRIYCLCFYQNDQISVRIFRQDARSQKNKTLCLTTTQLYKIVKINFLNKHAAAKYLHNFLSYIIPSFLALSVLLLCKPTVLYSMAWYICRLKPFYCIRIIITRVFSFRFPPSTDKKSEATYDVYDRAHTTKRNCSSLFPACPTTLLESSPVLRH
jgi:hypothetical protein